MKKFILLLAVCFSISAAFAQSAATLKNEGNAELKAKNYKGALEKYEAFMSAEDTFEDAALVFNSGYCAIKVKDYAKAVKYFGESIDNKYKLSSAYRFKALAEKKQKNIDAMIATLNAGIAACPTKNSKMTKMLATHFLKEGVAAQKANKFAAAEASFKKAIEVKSKKKADALVSLGTLYYNEGAKIMQAATPIANTQPDKYKAESAKAQSYYKKAVAELNKAKAIDPAREDVTATLATLKGLIK